MMQDRYYVQHLAERVFLVRERLSPDGGSGPDDCIVRSFDVRQDANIFAESMNEKQKRLDAPTDTDGKRSMSCRGRQ